MTETEQHLEGQLSEVESAITAAFSEGDTARVVVFQDRRDSLKREIAAAQIMRECQANEAHRAKIAARGNAIRAEKDEVLADLWRLMPEVRDVLGKLRQLEGRLDEFGDGRTREEQTGFAYGMADRMCKAIGSELRGTALAQEAYVPGEVSKPVTVPPHQTGVVTVDPNAGARDIYGTPLHRHRIYAKHCAVVAEASTDSGR